MRHLRPVCLVLGVFLTLCSHVLHAQRLAPRGATATSMRAASAARDTLPPDDTHWSGYYVVRDAAIGGGIGVLVGVATAAAVVHTSNVTDHSEDPLAYAVLSVLGGAIGLLVGAVVGAVHRE